MKHAAGSRAFKDSSMKRTLLISWLVLLLSVPLAEGKNRRQDDSSHGFENGKHHRSFSADEAVEHATARRGGRPLSVRPDNENGRPHYKVKMLNGGDVWTERVYLDD